MKTYYIQYYRDFANTYNLCYCETPEEQAEAESAGYERITRKEAIRKCSNERWAREHDQSFSGYGDASIVPWKYASDHRNKPDHPAYPITPDEIGLMLNGYIWE